MKTGFSLCGKTTQEKPCSGPALALYGIAVYVKKNIRFIHKSYNGEWNTQPNGIN
jgi:hypothetical protein